mmetsp:Transcript_15119/g.37864  ORF Transcript_15119/g.37864 Transcript_15119/m.37864 type:complete len:635 (+) Transcript_15119:29-1933(+)
MPPRASSRSRQSKVGAAVEADKENLGNGDEDSSTATQLRDGKHLHDFVIHSGSKGAGDKKASPAPKKRPPTPRAKSQSEEPAAEGGEVTRENKKAYSEWYSKNFQVDDAAPPGPGGRRAAAGRKSPAAEDEGGAPAEPPQMHPAYVLLAVVVAVVAFVLFGMVQGSAGAGGPVSAQVTKLQQQHQAIVSENKKMMAELKALEKTVSSDKSGAAITRLDKQLDKLASVHKELSSKQDKAAAEHGKVIAQVAEVKKELAKQQKDLASTASAEASALSAKVEGLAKQIETLRAGSLGAADKSKAAVGVTASDLEPFKKKMVEEAVRAAAAESAKGGGGGGGGAVDVAKIKKELREEVRREMLEQVASEVQREVRAASKAAEATAPPKEASSSGSWGSLIGFDLGSGSAVETAVKTVLRRLHDERVGSVDWTLAMNNAQIVAHSSTYDVCKGQASVLESTHCNMQRWLQPAIQLTPLTVLKAEGIARSTLEDSGATYLGHCWAMAGSKGYLTVKLDRPVSPTALVMEHAPAKISPEAGSSAPRQFRLMGWHGPADDKEGKGSVAGEEELASGSYGIDDSKSDSVTPHIHRFPVASARPVNHVRLEIESNHGNAEYTCLYHFRLHGADATNPESAVPGK